MMFRILFLLLASYSASFSLCAQDLPKKLEQYSREKEKFLINKLAITCGPDLAQVEQQLEVKIKAYYKYTFSDINVNILLVADSVAAEQIIKKLMSENTQDNIYLVKGNYIVEIIGANLKNKIAIAYALDEQSPTWTLINRLSEDGINFTAITYVNDFLRNQIASRLNLSLNSLYCASFTSPDKQENSPISRLNLLELATSTKKNDILSAFMKVGGVPSNIYFGQGDLVIELIPGVEATKNEEQIKKIRLSINAEN